MLKFLQGKKTFFVAAIGILYVVGVYAGFWELDEKVLAIFGLSGLTFLRSAVSRPPGASPPPAAPVKLIAALLLPACLLVSGCSTVTPGQDPVAVRAEQTIAASFEIADAFLGWESANRAIAPKEVREFAERVRVEYPAAQRIARALLRTYKANRTAENKANLLTVLRVLERLQSEVTNHYIPIAAAPAAAALVATPALVMAAIDGLIRLIALISGLIGNAKRTKEWTPEELAAVEQKFETAFASLHWQPAPPAAPEPGPTPPLPVVTRSPDDK